LRFGGLIITSRIEYLNAGASLGTSKNIMLHDRLKKNMFLFGGRGYGTMGKRGRWGFTIK
jgi:phage pi2 protein 07